MNKSISIIIPVYNVEKYLSRCIRSLLNQTFSDFEILLIDDGSTDKSGEICNEYSKNFDFIKVYHKDNGGLSDARNYGIDKSRGKYVTFVDPDDFVHKDYLKTLFELVQEDEVQVSCISGVRYLEGSKIPNPGHSSENVVNTTDGLRNMLIRKGFGVSAWGKLFEKEMFRTIRFPKGKIYEDIFTIPYVIAKSEKIAYKEEYMYYYFVRKDSITHAEFDSRNLMMLEGLNKLSEFIMANYPELKDAMQCRYIWDILSLINKACSTKEYKKLVKKIISNNNEFWNSALENIYLDKRRKFQVRLINWSITVYKSLVIPILKLRG